jgi:aspartyl-tRNA(Asn)/glutamyl-tRNA(Gln) amidotransferase subunit B
VEGKKVVQETRGWDDGANETYSQRTKESSHDYRYFPDPDIPKLKISEIPEFTADVLKKELPELPWVKRDRYKNEYAMTDKEVAVFVDDDLGILTKYFESTLGGLSKQDDKSVRLTINYFLTDYLGILKKEHANDWAAYVLTIEPLQFAGLIDLITAGDVNSRGAKDILGMMFKEKDASARQLADKHGLIQKSDASDLIPIIEKIIADNQKAVTEYKAGKLASLQFLTGQAMKATRGAGNPEVVKKLLLEKLG